MHQWRYIVYVIQNKDKRIGDFCRMHNPVVFVWDHNARSSYKCQNLLREKLMGMKQYKLEEMDIKHEKSIWNRD